MRTSTALLFLTVSVSTLFAALAVGESAEREATDRVGQPAVLLELFTSQGCSSCPPADRLLKRLGHSQSLGPVVPLAFHVDYWNYIGWDDPFAHSEWSDRQRRYARTLELDTIYTPQVVVNGTRHAVGSGRDEIESMVRAARREAQRASRGPSRASALELVAKTAEGLSTQLSLAATAPRDQGVDLLIAVFENGLTTEVPAGENANRTLENDYVVRQLIRQQRLEGGESYRQTIELSFGSDWNRDELGVAAFLQNPATGEVVMAKATALGG